MNWTPEERAAINQLCHMQDMPEEAVMKSALRLYQLVTIRTHSGIRMVFLTEDGRDVDKPVGLPAFED